ncbi:MAG: RluA family pseudouridine synthase [Nitrospinota bacterium]|nr:RluA family pseudouridine synthase [Nitrospinota bacterium]
MELPEADGQITVPPQDAGERVDRFAAKSIRKLSRSRVHKLLEEGAILVNGIKVRPSHRLAEGDKISVAIPKAAPSTVAPENIPLDIVYEDAHFLVVNKPAGMVVHPAAGNYTGTLVSALLHHSPDLSGVGGVARPGIVHRLDKGTSGLLTVAKTDEAHHSLAGQIMEKTMRRVYLAIVKGKPGPLEGAVEGNIARSRRDRKKMTVVASGGKEALTMFKVEAFLENHSLLVVTLGTGRTHQIRAHMAHINCPVLGDLAYGRRGGAKLIGRPALHSWKLALQHPATGLAMEFTAPMPEDMAAALEGLGGNPGPYV